MTTLPTPEELRAKLDDCERKVAFTDFASRLQDLVNTAGNFKAELAELRQKGYVYAGYLEAKSAELPEQLQSAKLAAERAILAQGRILRSAVERARQDRLGLAEHVTRIEDDIREAENQIRGTFSGVEEAINDVRSKLYQCNWYLEQSSAASFPFLAGEALYIAAEAEWVASGNGKNDPDGILYLTDQRLVFEQKETTGKTLGLFGGKKVQELEWELPLHQLAEAKAENKGFLGGKDMVYITLKPGAKFNQITLEVKGGVDCKWWVAEINRMISGQVASERVGEVSAEVQAQVRNAPTKCPSCNGNLPPLVAGQRQIDCPHCGSVIRL